MKTTNEIAEIAAQNLVARHKLDRVEGERGIAAWAWALGEPIDFETGLRELVAEAIELDRAQRRVIAVPSAGIRVGAEQPGEIHEVVTGLLDTGYTLDEIEWEN